MQNKIVAVVVTFNRKALLNKCVHHILNQTIKAVDVLVIDNASTDGTAEMIQEEFGNNDRVKYYYPTLPTGNHIGLLFS